MLPTKPLAQIRAEKINTEAGILATIAASSLKTIFDALTDEVNPQEVLDLLGPNAVNALGVYAKAHELLESLERLLGNKNISDVPAPDPEMFKPQADGTVLFAPPPAPPEATPEAAPDRLSRAVTPTPEPE